MTLDDIADAIGTVHEDQQDDSGNRLDTSDRSDLRRDRGDEYDGGWSPE